jgi:hypothetical protein
MAKIYSVVPLELLPGVKGEDFERLWREEYAPLGLKLGWKSFVPKADRGERTGRYAVIWEVPSVASPDRYAQPAGGLSEEGLRALGPTFGPLGEKLDRLTRDWVFTDYVELGK